MCAEKQLKPKLTKKLCEWTLIQCEPAETHRARLRVTDSFHLHSLPEAADFDSLEQLSSTSLVVLRADF